MRNRLHILLALLGVLFGIMTLKVGGTSLFTDEGRIASGNYVPFVLWFNFIAGFFYLLAGVGMFLWKSWALLLAKLLAVSTAVIFAAFIGHVVLGGAYEMKTLIALLVRGGFWAMAWLVLKKLAVKRPLQP